jgi:hypothetical protein
MYRYTVDYLRKLYSPGTRVCVDGMEPFPGSIPRGTRGTVLSVDDRGNINCRFDNGSILGLIPGKDRYHRVPQHRDRGYER